MALIDPLPTASELRIESRLRPEQVSPSLADTSALEDDIETRITQQAAVVEQRILAKTLRQPWPFSSEYLETAFPAYSEEQREALGERQQSIAGQVVEYFVLSDLYLSAGQLNEAYLVRSKEYQTRGEALLTSLEVEAALVADNPTSEVTRGAATLCTGRGDYSAVAEELGW